MNPQYLKNISFRLTSIHSFISLFPLSRDSMNNIYVNKLNYKSLQNRQHNTILQYYNIYNNYSILPKERFKKIALTNDSSCT